MPLAPQSHVLVKMCVCVCLCVAGVVTCGNPRGGLVWLAVVELVHPCPDFSLYSWCLDPSPAMPRSDQWTQTRSQQNGRDLYWCKRKGKKRIHIRASNSSTKPKSQSHEKCLRHCKSLNCFFSSSSFKLIVWLVYLFVCFSLWAYEPELAPSWPCNGGKESRRFWEGGRGRERERESERERERERESSLSSIVPQMHLSCVSFWTEATFCS